MILLELSFSKCELNRNSKLLHKKIFLGVKLGLCDTNLKEHEDLGRTITDQACEQMMINIYLWPIWSFNGMCTK